MANSEVQQWQDRREKFTRRSRTSCRQMPALLTCDDVASLEQWPLGSVKTDQAAGSGWTDCLLFLVDTIRIGGRGARRVRYDGRLYISYSRIPGGRVYLDGALTATALEYVTHVYGIDAAADKMHNATLKGY